MPIRLRLAAAFALAAAALFALGGWLFAGGAVVGPAEDASTPSWRRSSPRPGATSRRAAAGRPAPGSRAGPAAR